MKLPSSARDAARSTLGQAAGLARAIRRTTSHSTFPTTEGLLAVRGSEGMVEIIRDRHGVPHVFAASAEDAFFGHGFVHAQDRLFQMEGARRIASGRLAEVVGAGGLASDRLMRRCGLQRAATRDAAQVDGHVSAYLDAYARGVNEGVRHLQSLPPEFALLGDSFAPWTVADVMLVGRYLMFGFAGNWNTEVTRELLAQQLGPELASALDPVHPPIGTVTGHRYPRTPGRLLEAYEAAFAALVEAGMPTGAASNAWAVTSKRSATGAPLLASDPHVDVSLPGIFHVVHLSGGEVDLIGAGIPGVPGVVIGHNAKVSWGLTAGMADVADCYIEEFDPADPARYRTTEGWAVAEEIVERIDVLGGATVEERVLVTRHGPVVTPVLNGESRAIALRSTVVEGGDIATPCVALWRSEGLDEAYAAVSRWPGTTFNFVFASVEDRVAYRFAGEVPQRQAGQGLFPQFGPASAGPPAPIPADALPQVIDPPRGYVVSANNAPGGDLELGEEWSEPRRAERLESLLQAQVKHDIESFAQMQGDKYSANLVRLRDLLLARGAARDERVIEVLRAWDGVLAAQSAAGALLTMTYRTLIQDAAERVGGVLAPMILGQGIRGIPVSSAFAYRAQEPFVVAAEAAWGPWFDGNEDRDRRLRGAVERASVYLRTHSNETPERWELGGVQRIPFEHALGAVPGLRRLFSRGDRAVGGDVNTVAQAQSAMWVGAPRVRIAPGYRQVLDVGDWDRSMFMVPTGNSGIPGHPRYDDCIEEYVAGVYRPLLFSREAVEAAAEAWLVLEREGTS